METAATARPGSTRKEKAGVSRLPMPKPVTVATAPAARAATATSASNQDDTAIRKTRRSATVTLSVLDRPLPDRRVGLPKRHRFLRRAIHVPVIDCHALDQPHRRRPIAAGAMNECRLGAFRGD